MSTITTRAGKGSPLTNTEVDDNFTNLNTDKLENIENESLSDLSNVRTTLPTNSQVLAFNASLGSWEPQDASGGASEINDLTDGYSASNNIGIGNTSVFSNISTGTNNTIYGSAAGEALSSGFGNVFLGRGAQYRIESGNDNVAIGYFAGSSNTGATALFRTIAIGRNALQSAGGVGFGDGDENIAIGYSAGSNIGSGAFNIVIGNSAQASSATVDHEITLGSANAFTRFRIPGLQSGASDGDVMTYNAADGIIELAAPSGGGGGGLSQGKAIILAMVFG